MDQMRTEAVLGELELMLNYLRELSPSQEFKYHALQKNLLEFRGYNSQFNEALDAYVKSLEHFIMARPTREDGESQTDSLHRRPSAAIGRSANQEAIMLRAETFETKQKLEDELLRYNTLEFRYDKLKAENLALKNENEQLKAYRRNAAVSLAASELGAAARKSAARLSSSCVQTEVTGQDVQELQAENLALSAYMDRLRSPYVEPENMKNHWVP